MLLKSRTHSQLFVILLLFHVTLFLYKCMYCICNFLFFYVCRGVCVRVQTFFSVASMISPWVLNMSSFFLASHFHFTSARRCIYNTIMLMIWQCICVYALFLIFCQHSNNTWIVLLYACFSLIFFFITTLLSSCLLLILYFFYTITFTVLWNIFFYLHTLLFVYANLFKSIHIKLFNASILSIIIDLKQT